MRIHKNFFKSIALTTLFSIGFAAYGLAQDKTIFDDPGKKVPVIVSTSPSSGENNVDLNRTIEISFNMEMDEESINDNTLMLHATSADTMYEEGREMMDNRIKDRSEMNDSEDSWQNAKSSVDGTISYSNMVASFTPNEELKEGTKYTFIVTSDVKSAENVALKEKQKWSFTTKGNSSSGNFDNLNNEYSSAKSDVSNVSDMSETQDQVRAKYASLKDQANKASKTDRTDKTKMIELGKASHFVILAKEDVNNESGSRIKGNVGEGSSEKSAQKDKQVDQESNDTGQMQSNQNKTVTQEPDVNEAINDMITAYTEASKDYEENSTTHETKDFQHNSTLTPGVHEWNDSLNVASEITLSGSEDDVWIFKTNKDLTVKENTVFTLTDGAQADNIFWYVEGEVIIGKNAQFAGIILSKDEITLEEGAVVNGRMFSQASITLDDNTVTEPRSMAGQTTSKNK